MSKQVELQQNTDEQAAAFSTLADPTRLKLVKLLQRQRDPIRSFSAPAGLEGYRTGKGREARLSHSLLHQPGHAREMPQTCDGGSEHRGVR